MSFGYSFESTPILTPIDLNICAFAQEPSTISVLFTQNIGSVTTFYTYLKRRFCVTMHDYPPVFYNPIGGRMLQKSLEQITADLRIPGSKKLGPVGSVRLWPSYHVSIMSCYVLITSCCMCE